MPYHMAIDSWAETETWRSASACTFRAVVLWLMFVGNLKKTEVEHTLLDCAQPRGLILIVQLSIRGVVGAMLIGNCRAKSNKIQQNPTSSTMSGRVRLLLMLRRASEVQTDLFRCCYQLIPAVARGCGIYFLVIAPNSPRQLLDAEIWDRDSSRQRLIEGILPRPACLRCCGLFHSNMLEPHQVLHLAWLSIRMPSASVDRIGAQSSYNSH